jgi:hypothetical protein
MLEPPVGVMDQSQDHRSSARRARHYPDLRLFAEIQSRITVIVIHTGSSTINAHYSQQVKSGSPLLWPLMRVPRCVGTQAEKIKIRIAGNSETCTLGQCASGGGKPGMHPHGTASYRIADQDPVV